MEYYHTEFAPEPEVETYLPEELPDEMPEELPEEIPQELPQEVPKTFEIGNFIFNI